MKYSHRNITPQENEVLTTHKIKIVRLNMINFFAKIVINICV